MVEARPPLFAICAVCALLSLGLQTPPGAVLCGVWVTREQEVLQTAHGELSFVLGCFDDINVLPVSVHSVVGVDNQSKINIQMSKVFIFMQLLLALFSFY